MTAAPSRTLCFTCHKNKATSKCGGCLQDFCYSDSIAHHNDLSKQLGEVADNRDLFRQTLIAQTTEPQTHPLIQQIDRWESESIDKIKQTAEEARQLLLKHIPRIITELEIKLSKLTDQLRASREEDDFLEKDIIQWNEELSQLTTQLVKPSNIRIRESSIPLITTIDVDLLAPLHIPCIDTDARWPEKGIIIAGGNGYGVELNQLYNPWGLYIDDDDQTVYVSDCFNHRIVAWQKGAANGQIVAGGNGQGNRTDQLNSPTDVILDKITDSLIICDRSNARVVRWPRHNGIKGEIIMPDVCCYGLTMDINGYLYISDCEKHEVRRWKIGETTGTVVAGGNGPGDQLDQLDYPTHIFVAQDRSVYVSDQNNHRVMKWVAGAKEGIIVAGGQGRGFDLTQLSYPYGVIVDQSDTVYVADYYNDRIMRWYKDAKQGSILIGEYTQDGPATQLYGPRGLSFDRQGNLYISDKKNYRVVKLNIHHDSDVQ